MMLENKGNGFPKIAQACFARSALSIRSWNFGAIGHIPRPIPLHNGSKLVTHGFSLTFMRLPPAPEHRPLHETLRTPQGGQ